MKTTLNDNDVTLIVNALLEKAKGDQQAADDLLKGAPAGYRVAHQLHDQAQHANQLADMLENASSVSINEPRPSLVENL